MKQNAKICAIGETNLMKLEVFILGGQRIDERRDDGEVEERGLKKGTERG